MVIGDMCFHQVDARCQFRDLPIGASMIIGAVSEMHQANGNPDDQESKSKEPAHTRHQPGH